MNQALFILVLILSARICAAIEATAVSASQSISNVAQAMAQKGITASDDAVQHEVRPVVDPTEQLQEQDAEGSEDFDFEKNGENPDFSDDETSHEQELSGEEMSEHFADAFTEPEA